MDYLLDNARTMDYKEFEEWAKALISKSVELGEVNITRAQDAMRDILHVGLLLTY